MNQSDHENRAKREKGQSQKQRHIHETRSKTDKMTSRHTEEEKYMGALVA